MTEPPQGSVGPANTGASAFIADVLPSGADGVGLCAGCVALTRCQLGVSHVEHVGDELVAVVTCPSEREGVRGVAHGGWVADVFDDVLGRRLIFDGIFAVTASLNVDFVRPVPVNVPLKLVATIDRSARTSASILIVGRLQIAATDEHLATGSASMLPRDGEAHYERFNTWRRERT